MMQLFYAPRTRSFSTLWLMEEVGEPYERVRVDMASGAHKQPEFLAINPMGKVPALKDGEATMGDAAAICAYVADRFPNSHLAPAIGDRLRARYLYWLIFSPACIEPAMIQAFAKFEVPTTTAGWGSVDQVFGTLDEALQTGPWILGDKFSAADIMIGSGLNFACKLFNIIPSRPSFDRYIERCSARPAFQRAAVIANE
ncbi:MAG TPA: glutathione S-transferase family protein [Xanthobacteraceae bacterium]|nr:glutathione S-transferase family protein [Xanthobacteraceae bacterium]